MRVCVIGGANVDITARSEKTFRHGDSNPGKVNVSWGGVGRNIAHNLLLLGDEVELLTVFCGGVFGPVVAEACRSLGMDISHCEIGQDGRNSFFVSLNNPDGEMVGGIADMGATELMDAKWLSQRSEAINAADAVVADANLSEEALAWLIDNCTKPLYLDAVSAAKAGRIARAVDLSEKKNFFALKCNAIEDGELSEVRTVRRRYVSVGAGGLMVEADGRHYSFPALPTRVVNVTGGGDALLSGIVHAGAGASVEDCARSGLLCARCAVESPDAVSEAIKQLKI